MFTVLSAHYNSHYYIIIQLDQIAFLYVPTGQDVIITPWR